MSPLIDLQRRMVEAGRIRAGEKGAKGEPKKLDKWRLTSKDKVRLDHAAGLWGGQVQEWTERQGEWELRTETAALPIMLLPGQLPTSWYEMWSRGGCQRRCDGVHEMVSDGPCLCGDERECKPHTRMSVLLPDLPGIGSWMLSSTGWNAAAELAGAADLLQRASAQGVLIPARLRLEQRVEVKQGQTRRFAVPVIDIDISFRDLISAQGSVPVLEQPERAALPAGYTPLTGNGHGGSSLAKGLEVAATQEVTRRPKGQAPIPPVDDVEFDEQPIAVPTEAVEVLEPEDADKRSPAQAKKLNVLIGKLRPARITTEQLYAALAKSRGVDVDTMALLLEGARDAAGDLHWGPLRDSLTKPEASDLIERLSRLEENVAA